MRETSTSAPPGIRRLLLKLSGEALMGSSGYGIDPAVLHRLAGDIAELRRHDIELGVVIGGGNIFRGAGLAGGGLDRVIGDQMGMLATVMNSLAMQDALDRQGVANRVFSALPIGQVCAPYDRRTAVEYLATQGVAIFAAGTGSPFFTTDSAASLRAIEIGADCLIKATKVDGVYSADPVSHPDATFYPTLTYDQVLRDNLGVMDATAVVLCRDHGMALRVMNINAAGSLMRLIAGEQIGTLITSGDEDD